ncbi:MAG: Hsp33 family molecular chaperone HslO [Kofleriaceae bacterium]|nr:Hsp33 family molecular chaperone HslO [Kofleriaceae bacterium]
MTQENNDRVIRAMTNDGQFRVIVATMEASCIEAATRQAVPDELLSQQAELMVAAVLVRETMQPGNRVQIILKDPAGHRLVADALPDGQNRSIVNPGEPGHKVELSSGLNGGNGLMQVNYTLRNGDLHQGIVPLEKGAAMSNAIMHYLMQSEQIKALVCIESVIDEGKLKSVGGYVVQMTPEATKEGLQEMLAHMEGFTTIRAWLLASAAPETLISDILGEQEYALLANSSLCFGCTCSVERMILGLSTLPTSDIGELIASGDIEVSCDACGQCYAITTDQLAEAFIAGGSSDNSSPSN